MEKSVEICRAKRINSSLLGSSGRGGADGEKRRVSEGGVGEGDMIVEKMTSEELWSCGRDGEGEDWSTGKRRDGEGGIQSRVTFSGESSCEHSAPGRRVAAPEKRLQNLPRNPQNLPDIPPLLLSSGRHVAGLQ